MYAALVGRQLGGTAILLGHCGLEWNHANSKTLPANQAKEFALLNLKQDSYFHIDDVLCVVDEDSYDADRIVSKRTQAEESLGAEDNDEETVNNGNSRYIQAFMPLLQYYCVEQGFSDNAHTSLDARADLIYSIAYASRPLLWLCNWLMYVLLEVCLLGSAALLDQNDPIKLHPLY